MKHTVYIGAGSNTGDRLGNIRKALLLLDYPEHGKIAALSSLYETRPFGFKEQGNFYNLVFLYETSLEPEALFHLIKKIEKETGRKERERWHEREIDLDILLYDSLVYKSPLLTIPHPGLINRDFVILPLLEINNNIAHPESGIKIKSIVIPEPERCVIRKINQEFFKK